MFDSFTVKGEIVRIGKASVKCPPKKTNDTSICLGSNLIRIQRSDLTDFTSPFDLTDDLSKRNTSRAWQALTSTGLTATPGQDINLAYTCMLKVY